MRVYRASLEFAGRRTICASVARCPAHVLSLWALLSPGACAVGSGSVAVERGVWMRPYICEYDDCEEDIARADISELKRLPRSISQHAAERCVDIILGKYALTRTREACSARLARGGWAMRRDHAREACSARTACRSQTLRWCRHLACGLTMARCDRSRALLACVARAEACSSLAWPESRAQRCKDVYP